jgi:hypothetical protein
MSLPMVPVVVATFSAIGQTASTPLTTLFTPATPGFYRFNYYVADYGGGGGYVSGRIFWTDNAGSQLYGGANNTQPFYSLADPITISGAVTGTITYDFVVSLELIA